MHQFDGRENLLRLAEPVKNDYAKEIGFTGQFYFEPKPKEPTKHQYDFDSAACINFLRAYGLEDYVKMNVETNHATLAGHSFQHELAYAAAHPDHAGPLVLVGCGTFDTVARARLVEILEERMTAELRADIERLEEERIRAADLEDDDES